MHASIEPWVLPAGVVQMVVCCNDFRFSPKVPRCGSLFYLAFTDKDPSKSVDALVSASNMTNAHKILLSCGPKVSVTCFPARHSFEFLDICVHPGSCPADS